MSLTPAQAALREIAALELAAVHSAIRREAVVRQYADAPGFGPASPEALRELLAEMDPRGLSQTRNAIRKRNAARHLKSVS